MSMILLEPAYKILHATVKFKRRTISVTPFSGKFENVEHARERQDRSGLPTIRK
jgi:hypothetical protein